MSAPHEKDVPALKTGGFWIPGDRVQGTRGTHLRGSMWVQWMVPDTPSTNIPLILVHGGGGQGTDWLARGDGSAGWAYQAAAAGFPVYVVDRPGHGRSPFHPDVMGAYGPPPTVEDSLAVFAPTGASSTHHQWPWKRTIDGNEIVQIAASACPLPADLAESQRLDGNRLAALLRLVGPAVLITHSAGSPGGWLARSLEPDLVAGVVALEPMGPPFVSIPGIGGLPEGLTAVPLGAGGLEGMRCLVVKGSASPFAASAGPVVNFLRQNQANAELLALNEEAGISGNGHGMMLEENATEVLILILDWVRQNIRTPSPQAAEAAGPDLTLTNQAPLGVWKL